MSTPRHLANAIRALSMDAVQQAKSGHPGMPMGMADIAEALWCHFLQHNPNNPLWVNRDRFILSNGHGSMLLYSLLHLTGYDVSLEDIKNFRQLHAKTAGHPEYGYAPGVETTTGPLGQGIGNAVGMAIAEKILAAEFNQPGHEIIDHHTYAFLGDGCLMEGVSHEVCSLAGTLKLGKLIAFWDDNGISIDGEVDGWFTDNTPERFQAYGWQVIKSVDGHDAGAVQAAITQAQENSDQPTLICCRTMIGFGAPNKAGTAGSHGAPLGEDEITATRAALDWSYGPFEIPEEIYTAWDATERGAVLEAEWNAKWEAYQQEFPEQATALEQRLSGALPQDWQKLTEAWLQETMNGGADVATRKASQMALNQIAPHVAGLIGGSADLTGSNNTNWSGSEAMTATDAKANYLYYGVREFGMSAIMNGLALHGGFIPYAGTFLVFSDYSRNAIRMAALMKLRVIHVLTHDSIGLGEDGPTHQPVEHVASLRMIPNLLVWRPCDAVETAVAWQVALEQSASPSALCLSRQGLPHQPRTQEQALAIRCGGYVLNAMEDQPELILLATGSEVSLAVQAAEQLRNQGTAVNVVSMPCLDLFEMQSDQYQQSVLPENVPVVAIEAGVPTSWYRYTGRGGAVVGMNTFGESAPAKDLFEHFGFTVEHVVEVAVNVLASQAASVEA